jgi:hypothetical protein
LLLIGVPAAFRKQAVDVGQRAVAADEEPEAFAIHMFTTLSLGGGLTIRSTSFATAQRRIDHRLVFAGVVTVRPNVFCWNGRAALLTSIGSRWDIDDFAIRVSVAEERADVLAHFGEGVAAELPGLVDTRRRATRRAPSEAIG